MFKNVVASLLNRFYGKFKNRSTCVGLKFHLKKIGFLQKVTLRDIIK